MREHPHAQDTREDAPPRFVAVLGAAVLAWATAACGPRPVAAARIAPGATPAVAAQPEADASSASPPDVPIAVGDLDVTHPLPLRWHRSEIASRFWLLDNLSQWDERRTSSLYRSTYEERFGWTPADQQAAEAYARIRVRHARRAGRASHQHALMLLPPRGDQAERFARAFIEAERLQDAYDELELSPRERIELKRAFDHFERPANELLSSSDHLRSAEVELERLSRESRVGEYLQAMATFYGLAELPDDELRVHLLWAPDGHGSATQMGPHLLIPLSRATALDTRELGSWLGVVVHEFAHYLAGSLPESTKVQVSARLIAAVGLVNRRHSNIVDEATATALGNVVFMRSRLPASYDDGSFYAFEPDQEVPHAIDSLARAIAPSAARHLATPGAFSGPFLDDVTAAHHALFGDRIVHHTRVVTLFAESPRLRRHVTGLFPAVSRSRYETAAALSSFVTDSAQLGAVARWLVVTQRFAKAHRDELGDLEATLGPVLDQLTEGKVAACLQARRRARDGGLDFAAVGRDDDGIRRLLIAAREGLVPLEAPLCVRP